MTLVIIVGTLVVALGLCACAWVIASRKPKPVTVQSEIRRQVSHDLEVNRAKRYETPAPYTYSATYASKPSRSTPKKVEPKSSYRDRSDYASGGYVEPSEPVWMTETTNYYNTPSSDSGSGYSSGSSDSYGSISSSDSGSSSCSDSGSSSSSCD